MSSHQPPRLATWLLDRLGYTRHNAALAGDLLEEFAAGRTAAWYWRQTAMVISSGAVRNLQLSQRYFYAVLTGFAAQSAVALALWVLGAPHQVHGAVWVALVVILAVGAQITLRLIRERVTGQSSCNLQSLCSTALADSPAQLSVRIMVAAQTFVTYLVCYFLWTLICKRPSGGEFLAVQAEWLFLFALAPAMLSAVVARPAASEKAVEGERPMMRLFPEVAVLVAGECGAPVLLRRERIATSLFESGLAERLFGNGVTLEDLRYAVWLGFVRHYSNDAEQAAPEISLSEFAALVREASRLR
jgi:hypothetical protein